MYMVVSKINATTFEFLIKLYYKTLNNMLKNYTRLKNHRNRI